MNDRDHYGEPEGSTDMKTDAEILNEAIDEGYTEVDPSDLPEPEGSTIGDYGAMDLLYDMVLLAIIFIFGVVAVYSIGKGLLYLGGFL